MEKCTPTIGVSPATVSSYRKVTAHQKKIGDYVIRKADAEYAAAIDTIAEKTGKRAIDKLTPGEAKIAGVTKFVGTDKC